MDLPYVCNKYIKSSFWPIFKLKETKDQRIFIIFVVLMILIVCIITDSKSNFFLALISSSATAVGSNAGVSGRYFRRKYGTMYAMRGR